MTKEIKTKKIKKRVFSESMINRYIQCPKWCYHTFVIGPRKKLKTEVIEQTVGKEVHKFTYGLRVKRGRGKNIRKFHYFSLDKAKGAWHITWNKAVEKSRANILNYSKENDDKNRWLGIRCIENYWNQNFNRPDPISRELEHSIILFNNPSYIFKGVIDELRTVDIETIKKYRPEIVVNGVLVDSYDPVVVVDLKTSYYDYELGAVKPQEEHITNPWTILWQFVGYTKLYREYHNGKNPIGCVIYDLYAGRQRLIVMEKPEYWDLLMEHIIQIKNSIENNSFPRQPRLEKCRGCGLMTSCWKDGNLYKFIPVETTSYEPPSYQIGPLNFVEEASQPRLKLKGVKRVAKNPQV
jgi:CRISPR/Cas system-associated exonuclease Cas4 (RecB family)